MRRLQRASLFAVGSVIVTAAVFVPERADARRGDSGGPLVVTAFVENNVTSVRRNASVTLRFSTRPRRRSVDARTVRVLEETPDGRRETAGARIVRGASLTFDPTISQRLHDSLRRGTVIGAERDLPLGFAAFQDYVVELPGPGEGRVLRSTRRRPLAQRFAGRFRTNGEYDDPTPGQPFFVGDHGTGLLGFEPPRSGATGEVDESATVVLEFSEPIDPNSLDPGRTVLVERLGAGPVPGSVVPDPDSPGGRRFLFVPAFGFGSDLSRDSGWDIRVTLVDRIRDDDGAVIAPGITDLAGNPLKRGVQFQPFRTRFVPGKSSASLVFEGFDDQFHMDAATPGLGGEWDTARHGYLDAGTPTTYPTVEIRHTSATLGVLATFTRQSVPLVATNNPSCAAGNFPQGSRVQMLYTPSDVGPAAAITRMGFGPSSNNLYPATHPAIELRLGHTTTSSLTADFAGNLNLGKPVLAYQGPYSIPSVKNVRPSDPTNASGISPDLNAAGGRNATGFWPWPQFTLPFEWNGSDNLIFDAKVQAGSNCQILRGAFVPAATAFGNRRAVSSSAASSTADYVVDSVIYDVSFDKRRRTTQGVSTWYDVLADGAVYGAPIVSPVGQPAGVQVLVELEGAPGRPDPLDPSKWVADASRGTGWTSSPADIDGRRFFRFRVTMIANLSTDRTATVDSIQFPFRF